MAESGRRRAVRSGSGQAAMAAVHGGAPVRELICGGTGDLQEVDRKLFRGLARAEKGRRLGRGVEGRRPSGARAPANAGGF